MLIMHYYAFIVISQPNKKIVRHIKMVTIPLNELRLITERRSIKN